jgi:hypothetical protein
VGKIISQCLRDFIGIRNVPASLNGFGLWNSILAVLMRSRTNVRLANPSS